MKQEVTIELLKKDVKEIKNDIADLRGSSDRGWKTGDLGTNSIGGGAAHNNMPPYLVVYMWKRTA